MFRSIARAIVVLVLTLVVSPASVFAQGELGTITGTLKDAQGAVLPGVTAAAVNAETNVPTTAVTNEQGIYLLSSLVNGRYKVTFTLPRLQHRWRASIEVRAGDRLRVDLGAAGRRA